MGPQEPPPARGGTARPRSPTPTQRGSSRRAGHRLSTASGAGLYVPHRGGGNRRGQGQRPWRSRPGRGRRGVNCSRVTNETPDPAQGVPGPAPLTAPGARFPQPWGPQPRLPGVPVLSRGCPGHVCPLRPVPLPPPGPAPHRPGPAPPPRRPIARRDSALLRITPPTATAWPRPTSQWQLAVSTTADRKRGDTIERRGRKSGPFPPPLSMVRPPRYPARSRSSIIADAANCLGPLSPKKRPAAEVYLGKQSSD